MFYVLDFKTHRFISCSNADEVFVRILGLLKEGVHQSNLEIINGFGEEVRFDVDQFRSYCKTLSLTERTDLEALDLALEKEGELQERAPAGIEIGMTGTIKSIPGIKRSLHGKTFVVTQVDGNGYITGTIEGKSGFYGVLRDDLENLSVPAVDRNNIFQDKPIAKWSFTGMHEEYEMALRELLASGKNFDTGWGYSTDVSAYLRVAAEGNALAVDVRKEIEPDAFRDFIENATEGDWAKIRLTEDVMDELVNYLEEHSEYTKRVSRYSMPRDANFEEISNVIDQLEDRADDAMKILKNDFKRIVHQVLLANIPDEEVPEAVSTDVASLKGEISNLRHELNGVVGYEGEEELVPVLEKTLFQRECELFAAGHGMKLEEGHRKKLEQTYDNTEEEGKELYIDEVVRTVIVSGDIDHGQRHKRLPEEQNQLEAELISDIKKQFAGKASETSYGEPQAWVMLKNGRSIEVTLEQEGLEEEDYFFSVRLHCNETEYDNGMFHSTIGAIDQYSSSGSAVDEIDEVVRRALLCNEKYPVETYNIQESVSGEAKKKGSLHDQIRSAAGRMGAGRPETNAKGEGIRNGFKDGLKKEH